jgi:hypothetical protein
MEDARGVRLKTLFTVVLSLLALTTSTSACSLVGCIDRGIELQRNFVVEVTHGGKHLSGVSVRISGNSEKVSHQLFAGLTGANGTVHIANLAPGDYWLAVDLLGIEAGYECFHINTSESRKAKRTKRYEWGDLAAATRQAAGRLVDSQPGTGGSPLENLVHRAKVPIADAKLELHQPVTGAVYTTISDANGHFAFDRIPDGTYVLHIDAGTVPGGRAYDSADLLIRISDTAKRDTLLLARREAGGGSCGEASLELQDVPRQ